ncbi:MarR family transcriptional regulator [Sphingomonas sp.]|uniref:MarR family winged helix-turn-helix transcriptional regulator n=1 Tax=Sphingomonas sp. TaxID=28214 RepID=UPI001EB427B9|nr:MarR family transcriptional regulator [Sphingomonas sp.]MBX3593872.1 MarR family transcriptional regulator [Sphingomonas sp.]
MSDTLGFLIGDVSRLLRREFDLRARRIGVTRAQWRTLKILTRHEGSNQGTLADLLEVEPITLARMIDRLEEAGLVERRRDPADRRAWRIHLTDAAQPLLAQLRDLGDSMLDEMLIGISPDDQRRLLRSLEQIRANLSAPEMQREAANG